MKKFILNFKQTIRFIVSIIVSREFAFVYCVLGTVAQVSHTYFLTNSISSLTGGWRTTQAVMLSIFISSSLLYFTAIADNADTKESKKVHFAVTMFTIIEILINIYYYSRHLIIDQPDYQIFDFIFAILISCLIPVTIKLYSSHIRAKEWVIDIEHDKSAFVSDDIKSNLTEDQVADIAADVVAAMVPESIEDNGDYNFDNDKNYGEEWGLTEKESEPDQESDSAYDEILSEDKVKELLKPFLKEHKLEIEDLRKEIEESKNPENNEKLNAWFEKKALEANNNMTKSFEKNSELFLTQFENKIKMMIKNNTENL